jgi:hypothetical protein
MAMYLPRQTPSFAKDLDQGDVLTGILRPEAPLDTALHLRTGGAADQVKTDEQARTGSLEKLRSMVKLKAPAFSMVVSNSCDNFQEKQLLLVPLIEFKFGSRAQTDSEKWAEIQSAATGGPRPGAFYMPAENSIEMPRSRAMLDEIFAVAPSWVDLCFRTRGAKRIAGLSQDGLRHLHWALGYFFSRNPRGDLEWPSDEDLLLKWAYLNGLGAKKDFLKVELEELEKELERRGLTTPTAPGTPAEK